MALFKSRHLIMVNIKKNVSDDDNDEYDRNDNAVDSN